jgi:hypothetical protein
MGIGIAASLAAEQGPDDSLEFVRVTVPAERLRDVPLDGGRLVPMPLADFDRAVAGLLPDAETRTPRRLADEARSVELGERADAAPSLFMFFPRLRSREDGDDDYDYDPNIISSNSEIYSYIIKKKNIKFFKRNYNTAKTYLDNVFPFPYIMFGYNCNIDTINTPLSVSTSPIIKEELFFCGTLFQHEDKEYGLIRNRFITLKKISVNLHVYYSFNVDYNLYLNSMNRFKYSLDLLGVGDPNKRTFEILSTNSLRLAERSTLKWPFEEDFPDLIYFSDDIELCKNLKKLESDPELYNTCLLKQKEIVSKYMSIPFIQNYIQEKLL